MTGTGISTSVVMARWWTATRSATASATSGCFAIHLRSAPAQKAGPVPVRTTGRRWLAACRRCSTRASRNSGTSVLCRSGRSRRTTTMPPRSSVEMSGATGARMLSAISAAGRAGGSGVELIQVVAIHQRDELVGVGWISGVAALCQQRRELLRIPGCLHGRGIAGRGPQQQVVIGHGIGQALVGAEGTDGLVQLTGRVVLGRWHPHDAVWTEGTHRLDSEVVVGRRGQLRTAPV